MNISAQDEDTINAINSQIIDTVNDISTNIKINFLKNNFFYNQQKINLENKFILENLPYDKYALEPFISSETLEYHHSKHHANYLNLLNQQKNIFDNIDELKYKFSYMIEYMQACMLAKDKLTKLRDLGIYYNPIINETIKKIDNLFNNVAQCINHSFYWQSMRAIDNQIDYINDSIQNDQGSQEISKLTILSHFKSEEIFIEQLAAKASHFASAWIWLVMDSNKHIFFFSTSNAENPLQFGLFPLLVCDIWEHAYYIDYRNRRLDYVKSFAQNLINWNFVAKNYEDGLKFFNLN